MLSICNLERFLRTPNSVTTEQGYPTGQPELSVILNLFTCQYGYCSVYLSVWLLFCLPVSMVIVLFTCQYGYCSVYLSVWLLFCLLVSMVIVLFTCQYGYCSVYLSKWLLFCLLVSMVIVLLDLFDFYLCLYQ